MVIFFGVVDLEGVFNFFAVIVGIRPVGRLRIVVGIGGLANRFTGHGIGAKSGVLFAGDITGLFGFTDRLRWFFGIPGRLVRVGFGRRLFRFGFLALLGLDERLPVGDRDLIIIRMDFGKGEESVSIAAVVDEGRLQRRLDPGYLGEIDISAKLFPVFGFEVEFLNAISADDDHPSFLGVAGIDEHFIGHKARLSTLAPGRSAVGAEARIAKAGERTLFVVVNEAPSAFARSPSRPPVGVGFCDGDNCGVTRCISGAVTSMSSLSRTNTRTVRAIRPGCRCPPGQPDGGPPSVVRDRRVAAAPVTSAGRWGPRSMHPPGNKLRQSECARTMNSVPAL